MDLSLLKKIRANIALTYTLTWRGFGLHFLEHLKLNYAESRMGNTWFPVSVVRETQTGGSKMSLNLISQASVNIRLQKRFVILSISVDFTVIFTLFSLEQCFAPVPNDKGVLLSPMFSALQPL